MYDLCLILPHLGPGGAQRVAVLVAEHYALQGLRVCIVILLPGKPRSHSIPAGVDFYDLGPSVERILKADYWNRSLWARMRRFLLSNIRRVRRLFARFIVAILWPWISRNAEPQREGFVESLMRWSLCQIAGPQAKLLQQLLHQLKPKRVLSLLTRTNILACQALWSTNVHLVVSERNDPSLQVISLLWQRLRDLLYQRADVLTANTSGVLLSFQSLSGMKHITLLPNPVPLASLGSATVDLVRPDERVGFITLARLVHQKGIDVLLHAMASADLSRCDWPLHIVGDGPERATLEQLSAQLDLEQRVAFLGFQDQPLLHLIASAVFILPSRFEGMPNALLEAMSCGLAVIVTDASPGPLEVVEPGVNGLVVPSDDPHALAAAMARLAADPDLRSNLGASAKDRITALDWPQISNTWNAVLGI